MLHEKKEPKIFPKEKIALEAFGERVRLARKRRKMSMVTLAARADISRMTLNRVESGSAKVAMGIFFRVMSVLHLESDFERLARDDKLGNELRDLELKRKRK